MADDQNPVVVQVPPECTEAISRALKNSEHNKYPADDPFYRAIDANVNLAITKALVQELPACLSTKLPNGPFSLVPKVPSSPSRNR